MTTGRLEPYFGTSIRLSVTPPPSPFRTPFTRPRPPGRPVQQRACYESALDSLACFWVSPALQFARPGQNLGRSGDPRGFAIAELAMVLGRPDWPETVHTREGC